MAIADDWIEEGFSLPSIFPSTSATSFRRMSFTLRTLGLRRRSIPNLISEDDGVRRFLVPFSRSVVDGEVVDRGEWSELSDWWEMDEAEDEGGLTVGGTVRLTAGRQCHSKT